MPGLILLMLPLAELLLVLSLVRHAGWLWVLAGLFAGVVLGSQLIRRRWAPYFREAMAAMSRQEAPSRALVNGLAWYVAGVLLMIPGFITDALALLVLLPPVRRLVVSRLQTLTEGRFMKMQTVFTGNHGAVGGSMRGQGWQQGQGAGGDVFEGEAREIDDDAPALDKK